MPRENFKCRFCYIIFNNIQELTQHFKKRHKKQQNRFKYHYYKAKVYNKLNITHEPKETISSLQEKTIQNYLSQRDVYFEMHPSFFVKGMNKEVFPTFIIYSWDNKKLKNPLYLWIETEDVSDFYYIKKYTNQGENHFIIRNTEKKEQYIESLVNKFINVTILKPKVIGDSKYTVITL